MEALNGMIESNKTWVYMHIIMRLRQIILEEVKLVILNTIGVNIPSMN